MQWEAYEDDIKEANPALYKEIEDAIKGAMASVKPFENQKGSLGGVTPYSKVSIEDRAKIQAAAYKLGVALEKVCSLEKLF